MPRTTRVLQFGEGVFLRGFVEPILDDLHRAGKLGGGVVIVKPRPNRPGQTTLSTLDRQEGVYTVLRRGLLDGERRDDARTIGVVQRALDPGTEWHDVLEVARAPDLRYVFSNTTESGIALDDADRLDGQPPASFPAKLAAVFLERWRRFGAASDKGLAVFPCELIERNGQRLRAYVLDALKRGDAKACATWVEAHCTFVNTLVDRIVTGTPEDRAAVCEKLGYDDELMVATEPYGFLAIDAPEWMRDELPLHETDLEVRWGKVQPFRERKVRMLNGMHIMMALLGPRLGLTKVRAALSDDDLGPLLRSTLQEEIAPCVPGPTEQTEQFCNQTLERLNNPFIEHALSAIAINCADKVKVRLLPTISDFTKARQTAPEGLTLALAALLLAEHPSDGVDQSLQSIARQWQIDLYDLPGLADAVREAWQDLRDDNLRERLSRVSRRPLTHATVSHAAEPGVLPRQDNQ